MDHVHVWFVHDSSNIPFSKSVCYTVGRLLTCKVDPAGSSTFRAGWIWLIKPWIDLWI